MQLGSKLPNALVASEAHRAQCIGSHRIVCMLRIIFFWHACMRLGPNLQPLMQGLPVSGNCSLVVGSWLADHNIGSIPVISDVGR